MPITRRSIRNYLLLPGLLALAVSVVACSGPARNQTHTGIAASFTTPTASARPPAATPTAATAVPTFTESARTTPPAIVSTPSTAVAGRPATISTPAPVQPRSAPATPRQPAHSPAASEHELLGRDIVPTSEECVATVGAACFTPAQVRGAYNVDPLLQKGLDGAGQSVVIVVSFGSPTLVKDVAAFSKAMGLPDADVQQLYPLGTDFKEIDFGDTDGWASETTLDAEWIHAMAPAARIVVLVSPVSETEGVDGMPEFLALERYALANHLGTVISQSWDTSEDLLDDADGAALRADFEAFYRQATAQGVTIVTASGDHGPLGDTRSGDVSRVRAADWPASVPQVTSVGGTILTLNPDGSYGSERVLQAETVASGSGVSRFYEQPTWQTQLPAAIQKVLRGMRGEADVSAIGEGLIVYYAAGPDEGPHPRIVAGTSASAPIWAGILALAGQAAGKGLGNVNPALYAIGAAGRCFHDVTQGDNRFRADPGEPAMPGWDLPTGWGSPDAACLVPALARIANGG